MVYLFSDQTMPASTPLKPSHVIPTPLRRSARAKKHLDLSVMPSGTVKLQRDGEGAQIGKHHATGCPIGLVSHGPCDISSSCHISISIERRFFGLWYRFQA